MSPTDHGRFCWYDLMTTDRDGSLAFYGDLLGWRTEKIDGGAAPYFMIFQGDRPLGGVAALEDARTPSHWLPYVAVDDAAAACDRAAGLGGEVRVPPTDIGPGVYSVVVDPQGGAFVAWQPGDPLPPPPGPDATGVFCWTELLSTDAAGSQAFYEGLFGWRSEVTEVQAAGATMPYRTLHRGDEHFGGIIALPEDAKAAGTPTSWLCYVAVADVDAARDRAAGLGAAVMCPPTDIPDVGRFCVVRDPQGASLALFTHA